MKVISQNYSNWADVKEKRQEKIDTSFLKIRIHPEEFEDRFGNKLEHRDFEIFVYTSERTGKPHVYIGRVFTKEENDNFGEPISHTEPPENY